jgi:hypothetical protein
MFARALRIAILTGTAIAAAPVVAHAQAGERSLSLVAARRDTVSLDSASAVTAVFRVRNASRDSITAVPTLSLPRGWEPLIAPMPMRVAPNGLELWLAGVHAPSGATAGTYVLRASVSANGETASDSIMVRVAERRAIEVLTLDAPGWILSGGGYEARFMVRNRGNVTAAIALNATSSRGAKTTVDVPVLSLAPGASNTVRVQVAASGTGSRAQDDLIELIAQDQRDNRVRVTASSRTTLVPKSGGMSDNLATIPSTLTLRAARSGTGVAPASLSGRGQLPGTKTTIDYAAYVPAKGQSPFGERDEFRFGLRSRDLSLRLGDGAFGFSQLTSSGAYGFGAQVDGPLGSLSGAAYAQRSRWTPNAPLEVGASIGTPDGQATHFELVGVGRMGANGTAGVTSASATLPVSRYATLSVEAAASDSAGVASGAERGHLSGSLGRMTYDLTHQWSGNAFAGAQRGVRGNDLSMSTPLGGALSMHAFAGLHSSGSLTPTAASPRNDFGSGAIGATYGSWGSVEYVWTNRLDMGDTAMFDGAQRGVRAMTFLPLGPLSLSLNVDRGLVTERVTAVDRSYLGVGGSLGMQLPKGGSLSFFAQHADGNGLGGDGRPSNTGGASAVIPVGRKLQFMMSSSMSSMRQMVGDGATAWFGQVDARAEYHLPSETAIALRAHFWINPGLQGARESNAVYLEVRTPLALPIGRQRRLGRVEGRVSDAAGKPMRGVLVHVGDQVAVTDDRGQVSLFGLASGVHPISLDAPGAGAQSMLVGDVSVKVDGGSSHPASFAVGVAQGARLRGQVRVLDFAATLAANADSLVDAGALQNVTVALQGTRDTLYLTSDDRGQINFGAVAPGRWTLSVMPGAELPEHHAFQNDRIELQLGAGDQRNVELNVVPRKRAVTFIGPSETIKIREEKRKQD